MTGLVVVTILALACAGGLLALLLAAREPAEGWQAWFRSSADAWRGDQFRWKDAPDDDALSPGDLDDLLALYEPVTGSAYTRPEELRDGIAAVRLRQRRAPAHR